MANAYAAYKANSVTHASKNQLLLMLMDGAVKFAKISKISLEEKEIKKSHENLRKLQNIFIELRNTLDFDIAGEVAENLAQVYDFIIENITEINIKKDPVKMDKLIPLIENIRDTWYEADKIIKNN